MQTPMVRQYLEIKKEYKDAVLFFRLGDFYEMFFDEAIEVSRILGLTLTKRNGVPMCGIPYHAYKVYVARLLRKGKKIAICEQVSDPSPGELTKREVIEVITPGVAVEDDFLEKGRDNYLMAVYVAKKKTGGIHESAYYDSLSYIDVSSGAFCTKTFLHQNLEKELFEELIRHPPSELLFQESFAFNDNVIKRLDIEYPGILKSFFPDSIFDTEKAFISICRLFGTESLKAFGIEKYSASIPSLGIIINYLEKASKSLLLHISGITFISDSDFLSIDYSTRKNLELTNNLNDNSSSYTLLEVIDRTKTYMGQRFLRNMIQEPIVSKNILEVRLDNLTSLIKNDRYHIKIRSLLSEISDIQRLSSRITMQKANARDMLLLSKALKASISLVQISKTCFLGFLKLSEEEEKLLSDISILLASSIQDDPPVSITEGNLIKTGYNKEVDRLRELHSNSQEILEKYVILERKKTGIQNLKIKYNKLIGYFLEVSKSNWEKAPSYFIKKRSTSNSDRYSTEELEKIVEEVEGASNALIEMEKKLFLKISSDVAKHHKFLQKIAHNIAELDAFQSLADVAKEKHWVRPTFTNDGSLTILNGRHPVVEAHMGRGEFIPNSIALSSELSNEGLELKAKLPSFAIITGPNMAGKSTFLRQTALIVLLAQIGSYVPADKVSLSPVDKMFCRVGASDNLARGESTFLVEMTEVSHILQTATKESLVIMDEVGRGTSIEDGISIARACSEYLLNNIGAKTLFATHYRELTQLEHKNIQNLKLDIMEQDGKIVFLKKVVEGVSKSSYGIHVAELAGLPKDVLERAKNLLHMRVSFSRDYGAGWEGRVVKPTFDEGDMKNISNIESVDSKTECRDEKQKDSSPTLFGEELLVINDILNQDLNNITPLKALEKISEWQNSLL